MNIQEDNNTPQRRAFIKNYFSGVRGFWICIGICFCVFVICFFVFNYPLLKKREKMFKNLEDLSAMLKTYSLRKNLYNNTWITAKKHEAEMYDKETEVCHNVLKEMDTSLEAIFLIKTPEGGLIEVRDEALWKNEYVKRISALLTRLRESEIVFHESALPFHDWGAKIPVWDSILPEQKRFWILESLVDIILQDTGVIQLQGISFRDSPHNIDAVYERLYFAIPFTIAVELEARRLQFLLHELLKPKIPFVIECVDIESTNKANHSIDVIIDAYAIDYKT